MEQKNNKVINGYKTTEKNYTNSELEFLQQARDLAIKYQDIYNEKKLTATHDSTREETPQKIK